jgi:hypothetical protein
MYVSHDSSVLYTDKKKIEVHPLFFVSLKSAFGCCCFLSLPHFHPEMIPSANRQRTFTHAHSPFLFARSSFSGHLLRRLAPYTHKEKIGYRCIHTYIHIYISNSKKKNKHKGSLAVKKREDRRSREERKKQGGLPCEWKRTPKQKQGGGAFCCCCSLRDGTRQ